jgi:inorganic triphosphatase YgiF
MTSDLEIEVKLSVSDPAAVLARLADAGPDALAGFTRAGGLSHVVAIDRYLDTADRALEAAGARARLRSVAGGVTLTVKRNGVEAAGVTTRRELEAPATDALDPAAWPDSPARAELLAISGGRPLLERARLRQRRTLQYVAREGTRVELSLDELEALDGDRVVGRRTELEAELKGGVGADDHAALVALAEALLGWPELGPATGSKRSFAMAAVTSARGTER